VISISFYCKFLALNWRNYFALETGSKYCDEHVCLSVCLFTYLRNHTAELHPLFMLVDCGCGSLLLWKCCDMLCTSGFVGDVTFSIMDPIALSIY